jgi:hypothetical protein
MLKGEKIICFKNHFFFFHSWLPNNEDVQEAMDSMVGNAYLYGRNYIAAKVNIFLSSLYR